MPVLSEVKITGQDKIADAIHRIIDNVENIARGAVTKAAENTAQDIKVIFKGGGSPGFKDRSGALRESIVGGLSHELTTRDDIVGFIGAGGTNLGSDGKPTKDYVQYVEFGEFSNAGNTSFLRAGVEQSKRQIASIIQEAFDVEKMV